MDVVTVKRKLETLQNIGYSLAGMYLSMVKFTIDNAMHHVKVALRDGEPIYFTAQQIIKNKNVFDISTENIQKLKQWRTIWINKDLIDLYNKNDLAKQYFEDNGLNEPFSYVDTGYVGSLSEAMRKLGKKPQTIFMFADKTEIEVPYKVMIDEKFNEIIEPYTDFDINKMIKSSVWKSLNAVCEDIFEAIPKQYNRPRVYTVCNRKVMPNLIVSSRGAMEECEYFYEGLRKGALDCKSFDTGLSNEYLDKIFGNYAIFKNGLKPEEFSKYELELDTTEQAAEDIKYIYKGI